MACDGRSVTVQVPLTFRRRGGRKQVVAPEGWPRPALAPRPARVGGTLVKTLALAHRWQAMLDSGGCGSIEELVRAERINPSYLARILRLTLLAPEIVESILDGRHDPDRQTDAEAALADRLMTPLGGSRAMGGHKGYGLAAMVEVLSTLLGGATYTVSG